MLAGLVAAADNENMLSRLPRRGEKRRECLNAIASFYHKHTGGRVGYDPQGPAARFSQAVLTHFGWPPFTTGEWSGAMTALRRRQREWANLMRQFERGHRYAGRRKRGGVSVAPDSP
jgi:hypothetical protein